MITSLLLSIRKREHFLHRQIIDLERHPAVVRQLIADGGGGIERIGIVLEQLELPRPGYPKS